MKRLQKCWALACMLMLGAAFSVSGEEILNNVNFLKSSKSVKFDSAGIASVSGRTMVRSRRFPVDLSKKYTLAVSVKAPDYQADRKSWVLTGFDVFDKNNVRIQSEHVFVVPKTISTVAAAAKKGDNVILLKGGAGFGTGSVVLVQGAKKDLSDLPNRDVVARGIDKVEKTADGWKIILKGKLLKDVPAGAVVRQHRMGGYVYAGGQRMAGSQWGMLKGTIQGMQANYIGRQWPTGTAFAEAVLLLDWQNKKVQTQIKDFSLTAE